MILQTAAAASLATSLILPMPHPGSEEEKSATVESSVDAGNTDAGVGVYGEVTETIPQEGAPTSGEPPTQEHPTVTASDPSMWDEHPHQKCVSDGGQIPDMNCIVNMISRPTQPQEPTTAGGGGPRVVTITTREAATLIAAGSGITRQPPGPQVIITKAFIVYTDPTPRYQTTTILGTTIDVEFTGLLGVFRTVLVLCFRLP